jgi:hypothetical protein
MHITVTMKDFIPPPIEISGGNEEPFCPFHDREGKNVLKPQKHFCSDVLEWTGL